MIPNLLSFLGAIVAGAKHEKKEGIQMKEINRYKCYLIVKCNFDNTTIKGHNTLLKSSNANMVICNIHNLHRPFNTCIAWRGFLHYIYVNSLATVE